MVNIYLVDHKDKQLQRLGMADSDEGVLEILQYLIDGMDAEKFDAGVAVENPVTGQFMTGDNLKRMRERYGLRKRTFDEKLAGVQTWKTGLEKVRAEKGV